MLITILTIVELSSKVLGLNDYSEPQQAVFWWFIPIIIVAGLGLIIMSGDSPKDDFKGEKSVNLAILGPNEAGKTTLWNFFRGTPDYKDYHETEGTISVSFITSNIVWTAIKPDKSESKLKFKGYDINGNGDFIRRDWEKLIEKSNMVIFVFNAYEYLKNTDYQRDINQRMQFVHSTVVKQTDGTKRGIWLLGSYADKLSDRKKDWETIIDIIKKKPYCEISNNNACINLTNGDELKKYYKKMFAS